MPNTTAPHDGREEIGAPDRTTRRGPVTAAGVAMALALLALPTTARAACVPTLYNCYCTYQSPCPVTDVGDPDDPDESPPVAPTVATMNALGTQANTLYGTKDPSLDSATTSGQSGSSTGSTGNSTPVGAGNISASSIETAMQMIRNAIHGPTGSTAMAPVGTVPNTLPVAALGTNALPTPEAQAAQSSGQTSATGGASTTSSSTTTTAPAVPFSTLLTQVGTGFFRTATVAPNVEATERANFVDSATKEWINAYARSVLKRASFTTYQARVTALETEAAKPATESDEERFNTDARMALSAVAADASELMTVWLALKGGYPLYTTTDRVQGTTTSSSTSATTPAAPSGP